jgi:serine/threonine protein kinase
VAIKELLPELTRSGEFLQRFKQKAKIQARLDHTNIVFINSILDYIEMGIDGDFGSGKQLQELVNVVRSLMNSLKWQMA